MDKLKTIGVVDSYLEKTSIGMKKFMQNIHSQET